MNAATLHPLARDYLKRLKKAAAVLPPARRGELLAEIESHLSEALPAGASETEALNVLERLGEPAEIVAEAGAGQAPRSFLQSLQVVASERVQRGGVHVATFARLACRLK